MTLGRGKGSEGFAFSHPAGGRFSPASITQQFGLREDALRPDKQPLGDGSELTMNSINGVDFVLLLTLLASVVINGALGALIGCRTHGNAAIGTLVGVLAGPFGWVMLVLDRNKPATKEEASISNLNRNKRLMIYVIEDKEHEVRKARMQKQEARS